MDRISSIFPSWTSYAQAFTEYMNSPDYNLKFPDYAELISNIMKVDIIIVKELINLGYNPQEGLDSFVDACLDGTRYLKDASNCGIIRGVILQFINNGAVVNDTLIDKLFLPRYSNIEDESCFIEAKGIMIDELSLDKSYVLSKYRNVSNVKATYWEDIPVELDFHTKFIMYLKYCSKYLQSLSAYRGFPNLSNGKAVA
jgi:hypothetical protein